MSNNIGGYIGYIKRGFTTNNIHIKNDLTISGDEYIDGDLYVYGKIHSNKDISGDYWDFSNNNIYNTNTGNVGIGTKNPIYKLDISGNTNILGDLFVRGKIHEFSDTSGDYWDFSNNNIYNTNTGNVGIGTKNPIYKLDVFGETRIQSDNIRYGFQAGLTNQGNSAVAVGSDAGKTNQGNTAVAIGASSAIGGLQALSSICIGNQTIAKGDYSVVIGAFAQNDNIAHDNCVIINGSGVLVNTVSSGSCYISPINSSSSLSNKCLIYDIDSKEVSYSTSKTFIIDHPIDNDKYLVHACLEGPEAGVYYRGTGIIENNEKMTIINLPDYVSAFATDLHVTVSLITEDGDNICNLSVSSVKENKFKVFRNPVLNSSSIFYWMVMGKRGDIIVEPNKNEINVKGEGPYKYYEIL